MNCQETQKFIPEFLDGELKAEESQVFKEHLEGCLHCQREVKLYRESWAMLSLWKDAEPKPGYISRFWTRLSEEKSWSEKILADVRTVFVRVQAKPVLVLASLVIIVGFVYVRNYLPAKEAEQALARMNSEEIEFVQNVELAQHFDVIENIDLVEDMDILENWDSSQS